MPEAELPATDIKVFCPQGNPSEAVLPVSEPVGFVFFACAVIINGTVKTVPLMHRGLLLTIAL
ncbi:MULTISPECIES: hypothetical protein [unclassified Tatumella]|uniref:hypothetical protein n=1 Tax=unclassified Tatumella TaxID=2649542 RepID=UPI001BAF80DD|nr:MULTISPECIES: hypothetical protein [unclassified Tatumella]MBS0876096.1 hypothetical protein [Tatumella sp. JGM82]MBS0889144.1 hypothetical protein [Tatumella sp. JGM94]MBS0901026.1 hypothetical protein [Tatumella sp. JGM100]